MMSRCKGKHSLARQMGYCDRFSEKSEWCHVHATTIQPRDFDAHFIYCSNQFSMVLKGFLSRYSEYSICGRLELHDNLRRHDASPSYDKVP
jgi:hypothetical protein